MRDGLRPEKNPTPGHPTREDARNRETFLYTLTALVSELMKEDLPGTGRRS